jgi:transcriptional regulator with PAS, ATPase and Fis domain
MKIKPIDLNHKAFAGLISKPQKPEHQQRGTSPYVRNVDDKGRRYIYEQLVVKKVKCIALAEELGVSQQTLYRIKRIYERENKL